MRKWTKGAKWDLMLRSDDGRMVRLTSRTDMKHTNADLIRAVEDDFPPMFKRAVRYWKRTSAVVPTGRRG
jgi:hypothetical protein